MRIGSGSASVPALGRHLRRALHHLVFTRLGGSVWLPGSLRRRVFTAFGARLGSAPGAGFLFGGTPANLEVGRGVYFNDNVLVEAVAPVTIGAECAFGMQAMVLTSHHGTRADGRWEPEPEGRPVSIGDRVWLGARAVVLPGAVVEDDVVIAAGAVVAGRCEAGGTYAGVPARRIRERSGTGERAR